MTETACTLFREAGQSSVHVPYWLPSSIPHLIRNALGTVVAVLDDEIEGDRIHRVKPDDGEFGTMLLLGRSLTALEDMPFVVEHRP